MTASFFEDDELAAMTGPEPAMSSMAKHDSRGIIDRDTVIMAESTFRA
ncbi:hypothetical protein [Sphingomonas sp. ERG5]|nr:hypothetical protein [Sphingomonas sp. ERG5]